MGRAARAAASAFVTWHTLVVVLAVAPDWRAVVVLRPLVRPYAALLISEGRRNFFAPNPDTTSARRSSRRCRRASRPACWRRCRRSPSSWRTRC